jgi:sRNA-binding protein
MVDRQTPTVESDEELTRDAEVARETTEAPATEPDRAAATDAPIERAQPREQSPAAEDAGLFEPNATRAFRDRWVVIQTQFVDEPRKAVEGAEALVGEVMQTLTESFKRERQDLESHWSGDRDLSTEDLRQAIRRYRSFFNRLLSI